MQSLYRRLFHELEESFAIMAGFYDMIFKKKSLGFQEVHRIYLKKKKLLFDGKKKVFFLN
jgi:hypothetical protein